MKNKWLLFLLVMFTAFALAACTANENAGSDPENGEGNSANATDDNDEEEGKVLHLNNGIEPSSFNPSIGFDEASYDPLNNLMEGLTRLNEEGVAEPATAEDFDVSDDGLTYTFHIRDDANWSNGDPVVAEDFEFAWKLMLDPETASPAAFLAYFIKGAEDFNNDEGSADDVAIEAEDDKTLVVELNAPTGFFPDLISNPVFFPIHHKVAEEDPDWHAEADSFVSNGPFELEEWEHEDEMTFVKNEEYWDSDAVNLDKVHFVMVNDVNTQYQMFESGEIDTASIPPELSDELIDGDNVYIGEQGGLEFYRFNLEEEPFQNKKIRQAFAYAVDKKEIAEYVVKNGVEPAYGFVSPGFVNPDDEDFRDVNGDLISLDVDKAQELLAEGMEEEGYDELPKVTLSYNTSDSNKDVAEAMQDMLKENLDIEVELENQEWEVFSEAQQNLELQFSRSSFINDYNDPVNFLESFITDSYMNRTGWSNDEFDELINAGKTEPDEEKRWDSLYEAEKLLAEEMPIMPIRYYNTVVLESDRVSGIIRQPVGYMDLKYADVE
ncbi:MAG TPA: peptide ABC transporter substrate-binding protein [Bacillota bacterium]|nr:peptide ABC transporter substrate-binding protein [Bacillota bacterium]